MTDNQAVVKDPHTQTTIGMFRAPSAVFTVATAVVGAANFAYHPLVSHKLSSDEYGALGALLGVLMVLAVPVAAMQIIVARDISEERRHTDKHVSVRKIFVHSVLIALAVSVVAALSLPLVEEVFALPSTSAGVLLALTIFPTIIQVVPIALLLSRSNYLAASLIILFGAAVRLASAQLLADSHGLTGAMAANLFGATSIALLSLLVAWIVAPRVSTIRRAEAHQPNLELKGAAVIVIGLTGFWALHAVHPMVARFFLDGADSGNYVAAATLGQLSVFVPALVAMRVFPAMVKERGRGPAARAQLVKAIAFVTPLAILLALATTVFGKDLTRFVLGSNFTPSTTVLGFVSFASAIAAVVYLVVYFFLAGSSRAGGVVAWSAVLAFCLMSLWVHSSAEQIARLAFAATAIAGVTLLVLAFTKGRSPIRVAPPTSDNLWREDSETLDLTMVVPFYNPGPGFVQNIKELAETLDKADLAYEIIAVSDGSTDNSADALEKLSHEHVRLVRQARNAGKGQALRVGLEMGRGHYLGFIDADGDIAPEVVASYLVLMSTYEPDIIFGSKRHPMSQVEYPALRRLYSFGYQQIIRWLFRVDVRDTQVGLKLVRRDVLAAVLPRMLEKRFAFDLELFVVSRHVGYRRVFEAPVVIKHGFTSTVSWRSVRGVFLDTAAIFYRLHLLHFYDEPQTVDVDGQPVVTRSTPMSSH